MSSDVQNKTNDDVVNMINEKLKDLHSHSKNHHTRHVTASNLRYCYVCAEHKDMSKSQRRKRRGACVDCIKATNMKCDGCKQQCNFANLEFTANAHGTPARRLCQFCSGQNTQGDGGAYYLYDGPDDTDRYLGGGEFDTDDGYYC